MAHKGRCRICVDDCILFQRKLGRVTEICDGYLLVKFDDCEDVVEESSVSLITPGTVRPGIPVRAGRRCGTVTKVVEDYAIVDCDEGGEWVVPIIELEVGTPARIMDRFRRVRKTLEVYSNKYWIRGEEDRSDTHAVAVSFLLSSMDSIDGPTEDFPYVFAKRLYLHLHGRLINSFVSRERELNAYSVGAASGVAIHLASKTESVEDTYYRAEVDAMISRALSNVEEQLKRQDEVDCFWYFRETYVAPGMKRTSYPSGVIAQAVGCSTARVGTIRRKIKQMLRSELAVVGVGDEELYDYLEGC